VKNLAFKKFNHAQDGAVAVEFALVSLLFITFVLGLIEFSRLTWTKQAVTDVAARAARCATTGDDASAVTCTDTDLIRNFAIAQAESVGISLSPEQITAQKMVRCNGYIANLVEISFQFRSPAAGLIPALAQPISVTACFPA